MYCGKCGTNNPEGARFCKECGASMDGSVTAPTAPIRITLPAKNQRVLGLAAVAIIVVIAIVVCVNLFGGNTPEAVASRFVESMFIEADSRMFLGLVHEEVLREEMEMDLVGDEIYEATCDQLDKVLGSMYEALGDYEVTYEIMEVSEKTGIKLLQVVQYYEDYDLEVSDAYVVEAEVTIIAEDYDDSQVLSIPLVKLGNQWYLDWSNLSGLIGL